jgi:hypothetical protein
MTKADIRGGSGHRKWEDTKASCEVIQTMGATAVILPNPKPRFFA